jgi:GntR family transcriptional repressor for pyruvate dehydrogenase complex
LGGASLGTAARPEFEAVRRNKLYEQVADRLERLIVDELKPGDKLPAERELALMFQVSRSSIRDAIRRLESMGLVESRQGAGTIVRDLSGASLMSPLASVLLKKRKLVGELLEVREMFEPALAARAATHSSPEAIVRMEGILRRQGEKVGRGELTVEEDAEFHYAIATAADNSVILKVLDVLMDLLRETRERSLQVQGRLKKSYAGHRRILAALKRGDPKAAEAAMRQHLQDVQKIVFKQL